MIEESDDDAAFWKALGGKGPIASAEAGGCDTEAESIATVEKTLYRLSDASGNFKIDELAKGKKIKKSLLDSSDVFILDAGQEVSSISFPPTLPSLPLLPSSFSSFSS